MTSASEVKWNEDYAPTPEGWTVSMFVTDMLRRGWRQPDAARYPDVYVRINAAGYFVVAMRHEQIKRDAVGIARARSKARIQQMLTQRCYPLMDHTVFLQTVADVLTEEVVRTLHPDGTEEG